MSKSTLLLIIAIQLTSSPNLNTIEGIVAEVGIFLVAVGMGTGVRIAMKAKSREGIVTKDAFILFFFGLSLGFVANYTMIYYGWNLPRPMIVWAVSFLAEFILIWIEQRYPKLFDSLFEKVTRTEIKDGPDNNNTNQNDAPDIEG